MEDVDAVDFFGSGASDGPLGTGFDKGFQAFPLSWVELFGVIELLHGEVVGKDYRRSYYGAGEATSTGFVQTHESWGFGGFAPEVGGVAKTRRG